MEESRIDKTKRFSKVWWQSRADARVSQEYVALGMGISRKTVQNWEKGISSPTLFQASEWFEILGLNPLPYFLNFLFPTSVDGVKGKDGDDKIEKALFELISQLPATGKRQLLYILYGSHGSSAQSILHLANAHLQTPMKDRIVQAAMITENYELEKALGNIVCPDNIQPDTELLHKSIENAKEAVKRRKSGYSNM